MKIRQDPDFVYEQESVQFLNVSARDRSENFLSEATHEPSWLGVNFISGISNTVSAASVPIEASQAYSVSNTTFENPASSSESEVNKLQWGYDDSGSNRQAFRRSWPYNSSTRLDFVDDFYLFPPRCARTRPTCHQTPIRAPVRFVQRLRQAQMTCTHY